MNKAATIAPPNHGGQPWRARFTTAEFLRMGELGAFYDMKVELVHGELERMNPPMSMHAMMQAGVAFRLGQVVRQPVTVLVEVGIDLGNDTVVGCDVAVVRAMPAENRLLAAADVLLVVEVAETTLARDLGQKRTDYAAAGVAHYWVVDRVAGIVHVHQQPEGSAYSDVVAVPFGRPLAVPGTDATITID